MHFNYLGGQWSTIRDEVLKEIDEMGYTGDYIGSPKVELFENKFAKYFKSNYAVGVSNGTDGLKLALQVLDLSNLDLVIIPNNTFVADYLAVRNLPGEKPETRFIDHDEYFTINLDDLETFLSTNRENYRKVVVMAVHLYGHPCNLDRLNELKKKYDFTYIEDCSQSHGTIFKERYVGNDGIMSVYSLYPGKNLGAIGDAGIITTNDEKIYKRLKSLRNYGSSIKYHYDELGHNHRLDTIQAIVLSHKLDHLRMWNDKKNVVADRYYGEINNEKVILPQRSSYCSYHSYHIFHLVVSDRESFMNHMNSNGIPTIIHYPYAISQTKIYDNEFLISSKNSIEFANNIVSIPIHPFLEKEEVDKIIKTINKY